MVNSAESGRLAELESWKACSLAGAVVGLGILDCCQHNRHIQRRILNKYRLLCARVSLNLLLSRPGNLQPLQGCHGVRGGLFCSRALTLPAKQASICLQPIPYVLALHIICVYGTSIQVVAIHLCTTVITSNVVFPSFCVCADCSPLFLWCADSRLRPRARSW